MDFKSKNELYTSQNSGSEESIHENSSQTDRSSLSKELHSIEELHKKYSTGIYTRCMTLFNNEKIVKEAIPYILLEGYVQLSEIDVTEQDQFFNHITYRLAIDIVQKATASSKVQVYSTPTFSQDYPIQELFTKEILSLEPKQLKVVLNKIPIGDKALLLMKYQDDMSIGEIAKIVGSEIEKAKIKLVNAQYTAINQIG